MTAQIVLGNTKISASDLPYVIAEAGSNFNQNLSRAFDLIDAASEAGANCVKFQLFRADKLYPNGGDTYELFKSIELNPDWVPKLAEHSKQQGLDFTCSCFDDASFYVLEEVGVNFHKIASSETTNLQLLYKIARSGKPALISTGMCDWVDIQEAVNVFQHNENEQFALLQCSALYPLEIGDSNVGVIRNFMSRYNCVVGFSDHTTGNSAALAAVGLGGRVFEKHFTLDKTDEGPDHFYAMEPSELKNYILAIKEVFTAIGNGDKRLHKEERENGRRDGLYFSKNLDIGHKIQIGDLKVQRPSPGLRSRYSELAIGLQLRNKVKTDQPVFLSDLEF